MLNFVLAVQRWPHGVKASIRLVIWLSIAKSVDRLIPRNTTLIGFILHMECNS